MADEGQKKFGNTTVAQPAAPAVANVAAPAVQSAPKPITVSPDTLQQMGAAYAQLGKNDISVTTGIADVISHNGDQLSAQVIAQLSEIQALSAKNALAGTRLAEQTGIALMTQVPQVDNDMMIHSPRVNSTGYLPQVPGSERAAQAANNVVFQQSIPQQAVISR
jgi:hypothetical protein